MKILVLCHKIPYPATDGGCIATLNMIRGLAEAGAEIKALCMSTPKHNGLVQDIPPNLIPNVKWGGVFVDTTLNPFNALKNIFFSKLPYNAERFISFEFNEALIEDISQNNYDVVQLEGLYLAPYIESIRKNTKAKIVLRSHNIEFLIWDRMALEEKNPIKKWYKTLLYKRVKRMEIGSLNNIDGLVPITKIDETLFLQHYNGPCKVSSTGILDDKFNLNTESNETLSLFHIGALDWVPNQSGLLWFCQNVYLKLKQKIPELQFIVAGRNAPAELESKLESLNVNYVGEVSDATVFIDEHDIMIVPLFSGSGMRIKIIEAMARGKCIVTTPVGAEGIPVINGKHIIQAKDDEEMVVQILNLLEHPEKVTEIGKNAFAFAKEHFNNSALTQDLVHFYNQILDK